MKQNVVWRMISAVLLLFVFVAPMLSAQQYWDSYDFGGETVRIVTRWGDLAPLGARGAYNWGSPDARLRAHIEQVEQMFNVKLEIIVEGNIRATVQRLREDILAGDAAFDIFHAHSGLSVDLIADGMLLPLNDYLDDEYYNQLPPELAGVRESFTIAGKTYGFASPHRLVTAQQAITWNQELFEREGLPNLYELFDAGEWTWAALLDIARQATKDTTGDGEIDQFGLRIPDFHRLLLNWPKSNDFNWILEEDGQARLVLAETKMIETLEFLQQLQLEGLVTTEAVPLEKLVMEGPTIAHILTNRSDYADAGFGIIPSPMGPSAQGYVSVGEAAAWGAAIPITTKHDPRALVEVMSALWQTTEPYINHMSIYQDLDDWRADYWMDRKLVVPDTRTFEMWEWIEFNVVQPMEATVWAVNEQESRHILRTLYEQVVMGSASATSVLSELEPIAQGKFEEYRMKLYE